MVLGVSVKVPFEQIIEEHGVVVLRVCRALLQPAWADDAWSETFLAALRAYPNLAEGSNVRGWLVTIAHRKSIDVIRAATRQPVPTQDLDANPQTGGHEVAVLQADVLRRAVSQLPDQQRLAIVYRYLADLAYEDVSRLLDCSMAAARRNVADGLKSLRTSPHFSEDLLKGRTDD
jgi:RNA polymerase sigma factor (sigma-70 family)